MLGDSPNTVASTVKGAPYSASAWVRAPAGSSVRLRLREYYGSTLIRSWMVTVSGNGAWRQLSLKTAAAYGGTSLGIEILASLTTSQKAQVDDLSLKRF